MAFDPKRFSQLARAGDFAMWVLQTTDAAAVVDAAGYIAPAKSYFGLLKAGHIVFRVTYTDTTYTAVSSWGIHILKDVSASQLDLADELAGVVTDTRAAEAAAAAQKDAKAKAKTDDDEKPSLHTRR